MENITVDKFISKSPVTMNAPHSHDHYEIQFLTKGSRIYFIEDVSYRIQPNSIVVIPPHSKHMTGGGAFERFNINVFPYVLTDFQKRVIDKFDEQRVMQIPEAAMTEIVQYLTQIEMLTQTAQSNDYAQCILAYIFYLIDKCITNRPSPKPTQIKAPLMIYRITDYINTHLQEKLSLEDIAKHCNCSVPYLCKLFLTHMQRPVYDYILMLRLDKVKKLLLTTTHSITEIAELCGFSSGNYLCLIFKKKEGLSPLSYKKLRLT